jgi:hypothetical protein
MLEAMGKKRQPIDDLIDALIWMRNDEGTKYLTDFIGRGDKIRTCDPLHLSRNA